VEEKKGTISSLPPSSVEERARARGRFSTRSIVTAIGGGRSSSVAARFCFVFQSGEKNKRGEKVEEGSRGGEAGGITFLFRVSSLFFALKFVFFRRGGTALLLQVFQMKLDMLYSNIIFFYIFME
jgi:hypothetical protein